MHVDIYTDGSATPSNPGHGGGSSVSLYGNKITIIAKYLGNYVTSIESELIAIERALSHAVSNLKFETMHLYTDSKYAAMSISGQYRSTLALPRTKRIRALLKAPELSGKVTLYKIAAHKNPEDFSFSKEKEAIYWNSVADFIAKKAAREGDGYFFSREMTLEEFKKEFIKLKED